jgi:integrase
MASIKRRDDGMWRARYRDEAGKEHARHFARKVDAQRWLDEVTAAVVTGQYVDPKAGRVTFKSFYATWAPRQVWQPTTVAAMDLTARSVTFGDLPLNRVRRSHFEQWVKEMQLRDLAALTIKMRVINARSIVKAAVRDRLIATDPSEGLILPRERRREIAMVIPTSQQIGEIMNSADEDFRPFVAIAAFAGLRLGEVAALRVEDIDFLRRIINVRRQVARAGGGGIEVRAPKFSSERDVFVPEMLTDLLASHAASNTDGHVRPLFTHSGRLLDHNMVWRRWHAACARAGVSGINLHAVRHYYASGLIAAGCDVVTVQRALGHANATTTLNTYSHLWPNAEDRTRAAALQLMREAVSARGTKSFVS